MDLFIISHSAYGFDSKNHGDRYLIRLGEMNLNIGMALKWIPFK